MGIPQLFQVIYSPVPLSKSVVKSVTRLHVVAWCWDWDGVQFVKAKYLLRFKRFRGTKEIRELDYYPLVYHSGADALCQDIKHRTISFLQATKFCKQGVDRLFKYDWKAYVAGVGQLSDAVLPVFKSAINPHLATMAFPSPYPVWSGLQR